MIWNPWHGCKKYSEGCQNCYVYRRDESIGKDASVIYRTRSFSEPIRRTRNGAYKTPAGTEVFTCMTSDFFLEEADPWRPEAWEMIRQRQDLSFLMITKRILRFDRCLPPDWGEGYPNVTIGCTAENQKQAELRLPVFLQAPIAKRIIICEPLLDEIHLEPWLASGVSSVITGGESGPNARICDYRWILSLREQCEKQGISFRFKQTGARLLKDGVVYRIPRKLQHAQARRAGINL